MRRAALLAFCVVALAGIRAAEAADCARLPDEKAGKKGRAEQARLQEFVRLSEKAANPAALIPHLRKLAKKAVTDHVRREAAYRLGAVCLGVRKTAEAERLFDDLSRSGEDTWAWKSAVELGGIRRARGELDEAIESYERILRKNVTEREAVIASLAVAEILAERGDKENARKALAYGRAVAKRLYKEDREALKDTLKAMARLARSLDRGKKVAEKGEAAVLLREGNAALARKNYKAALAKYSELLERFADSDEADEAGYREGLALYLAGKPAEARSAWQGFVSEKPPGRPEGPWRGHALLGLADIYLEHDLDPVSARRALDRLFHGIEKGLASWREAEGDAWIRKAIIEYIDNRGAECVAALERAQEFRPAPEEIARHGIPWGPARLVGMLRSGKEITPREVRLGGSPRARTATVLGDLYFEMQDYVRARSFFSKFNPPLRLILGKELTEGAWKNAEKRGKAKFEPVKWLKQLSAREQGKAKFERATNRQRAYARLREGRTHQHKLDFEGALPCYAAFLTEYARTPWAAEGVLRAAYLMNQMPPGGKAFRLPLFNLVLSRYPRSEQASSAAFSRALTYERIADYGTAIRLYREAMACYPTRQMLYLCKFRLAEINKRLAESERGRERKGKGGKE